MNIKSIFTGARKWLRTKATQFGVASQMNMFTSGVNSSNQIYFIGGTIITYQDEKQCYIDEGYKRNDNIYSIVNLILNTAVMASWAAYKIVDDIAYKQMKAEQAKGESADFKRVQQLHKKSLQYYTGDTQLNKLLKYPNPTQSFSDLNRELWLFKLVTGDYYEYWERPIAGLSKTPISLSALPSPYMQIKPSGTLPLYEAGYIMFMPAYIEFTPDEILHEKYPNPDWKIPGANLYGQAPLTAYRDKLLRSNKAVLSQAIAFENGGERGVVYLKNAEKYDFSDPKVVEQINTIKNNFEASWQPGLAGTKKTFFASRELGYEKMGISPVDQGINESEVIDMRAACNVFQVPSQLMNDSAAKTYNTVKEAEKALITRCVLPLLYARRDNFNRKYDNGENIVIEPDITCYDALQPDKAAIVDWVNKLPLTNARKLEMVGEDIPENMTQEERQAILMPTGFELLSDIVMPLQDLTQPTIQDQNINNNG